MADFLIIGAGISGCAAGLELANHGGKVEIIEKTGNIGGRITGYSCKATDDCSRCGVCIAHSRLSESLQHENINFTTGATLKKISQQDGKTEATIFRANPNIDLKKCTGCDACLESCPVQCITKYSRAGLRQYIIDYSGCLLHQGKACSVCAEACSMGAVYSSEKETEMKIECDALLLASGHEPWDASEHLLYGYPRIPGVITGVEAEQLLSARNELGKPGGSTAFIQCVGSRNPSIGRNYCSGVCCAYALRIARVLKYRNPEAAITVYYIDIQNFDKTFTLFREELGRSGINFVRGLPFKIEQSGGGRIRLFLDGDGGNEAALYDNVVLSVGLGPSGDAKTLADILRLETDDFGFYLPGSSSFDNVFVSGTCREPQNIFESITQAESEALEMLKKAGLSDNRRAEQSMPPDSVLVRVPLNKDVLVIGGGPAAVYTASELDSLGYETTLLSPDESVPTENLSERVRVLTGGSLIKLTGHLGSFEAETLNSEGKMKLGFGALVLASGNIRPGENPYSDSNFIIPMEEIEDTVLNLKRRRGVRVIGLVLDLRIDETAADMENALHLALRLQSRGKFQVQLFCREAKVSGPGMEVLYNEAREAGVDIIKFEDRLQLTDDELGASVLCFDSILKKEIHVSCDFIGISMNGTGPQTDNELAGITAVSTDAQGVMQDNNIHLFSCKTNRPGIFILGPCRGSYYLPRIKTESKAAALAVHSLLREGFIEAELSNAEVDPDKCILCLTCIRSCPFNAMQIDREKGAAMSIPELCQRCGICAGECPAKAIELPMFTDELLLGRMEEGNYAQ